jgi:hypothetical protein
MAKNAEKMEKRAEKMAKRAEKMEKTALENAKKLENLKRDASQSSDFAVFFFVFSHFLYQKSPFFSFFRLFCVKICYFSTFSYQFCHFSVIFCLISYKTAIFSAFYIQKLTFYSKISSIFDENWHFFDKIRGKKKKKTGRFAQEIE